ncbi:MAG: hypothetical protein R8N23_11400 [Reichenbachiella sp.]|uniref:hypothetical protein n=1 Tax=Reichenbachiella sp. TaxID=2184521 RepID=UPI002966074E|nr:hypothetical protein [Reichenbachiella sp.]MDW3210467.1 hypothetical protein [Reichenbachiella sp.]
MKKHLFLYFLLSLSVVTISSCGDDDEESCDPVPVCTNETATSCCTCADDSCCTYTYDGVEYKTEDEVADACGGSAAVRAQTIEALKASRIRAKASF